MLSRSNCSFSFQSSVKHLKFCMRNTDFIKHFQIWWLYFCTKKCLDNHTKKHGEKASYISIISCKLM